MKVVICGGRDLDEGDRRWMNEISRLTQRERLKIETVISGTARGGDRIGEAWATRWNRKIERCPADWERYGKKAGFIRNAEMVAMADAVIALPGGRGTQHTIDIATHRGKPVYRVL